MAHGDRGKSIAYVWDKNKLSDKEAKQKLNWNYCWEVNDVPKTKGSEKS